MESWSWLIAELSFTLQNLHRLTKRMLHWTAARIFGSISNDWHRLGAAAEAELRLDSAPAVLPSHRPRGPFQISKSKTFQAERG